MGDVMQVIISNKIKIENPSDRIREWCRQNLIIPNPEFTKKLRMNFYLGDTPEYLTLFETVGSTIYLPYGTLNDIWEYIDPSERSLDFTPINFIDYKANIPLYDYQQRAVDEVYEECLGILQSPAGSGKTQMGLALAAKIGVRTLWITHTKDLLEQSKSRAEQYIDSDLIGTITEGKINIGKGITFATIQTLNKINLRFYKYYWDCIIVDECHRCSGSPTSITQFYNVLNSLAARYKYGLSATVHRSDGTIKATYALLGNIIYNVPEEEVEDRVMRVGIRPIATDTEISQECLNTDGTLNYNKLITHLCNDAVRNWSIVNYIMMNKDCSSLILSDRLQHLEDLMDLLPDQMKNDAVMISGKMTTKKGKELREKALDDMRNGKKKYLFATYSLAKEGLDIPRLERLYMATPQKDYAVVAQSIGRIARVYEGKKDPICYDFVDNIRYLYNSYKKRCTTYRKKHCYFLEQ